jgi:PAS domain S-box-containing protein
VIKNKTALLKESAELERANLLEHALDAVVGANEKNVITFWNKNAEEIFGWSKVEALGQELNMIIPERLRSAHFAGMQRFVQTGIAKIQNRRIDILALRKNGAEFAAELTVSSIKSQTGYNFYSFIRDVSEQKQTQQAIKFQVDRLSLITNAIPDLIAYVGNDERYQFANASYEKWLGLRPSEIVGRAMEEVVGEAYERSQPYITQVLNGKAAHFTTKIRTPAGHAVRADVRYIPDFGPNQELRGFVIIAHDVTELETSREIVEHQSQYLEMVLNRIRAAVILVDPKSGNIKLANQMAVEMTGGLAKDISNYNDDYKLINARGQVEPHDMYPRSRAARGELIFGDEYTWVTPAGSWDYLMYADLLPSVFGQPATAMVSFLDVTALKNTERNLRQKESELRNLADAIPQLAWMANPDGTVFWFNQRWYQYTGTTFNQMHGWGWASTFDPQHLSINLEIYKKTLITGDSASIEVPIRAANGEYRWFLTQWLPLKDENGKVLRWFGTNTDVHEQKLARQDQEFRANLAASLNAAENLEAMLASATQAISEHLGVARCFVTKVEADQAHILSEFSKDGSRLQSKYELKAFSADLFKAWKSNAIVAVSDVSSDLMTKNDASSHLADSVHAFVTVPYVRAGALVGAMNVADNKPHPWNVREIELLKIMSETVWAAIQRFELLTALKLSTHRSAFIAKASKVLNSSLDTDKILRVLSDLTVPDIADWCSIRMVNNEGELQQVALSHRDPEKAAWGWELQKRFPPSSDSRDEYGPYKVLRTGIGELIQEIDGDLIRRTTLNKDQAELLLSVGLSSYLCVPILCRDRAVGTLSLVFTNESARKFGREDLDLAVELGVRAGLAVENAQLYREAQAVNRLKDEFLANLSHELRTPMNVIQGYAELLQSEGEFLPQEDFRDYVDAIQRNGKALTAIIADLLDVSSIITGKISYKPVALDPAEVIPQILESLRPTAAAKGVKLTCDIESAPRKVNADSTRLHQIVWNLVSNAIKFTEAGGHVAVLVGCNATQWMIQVADSGRGIDADFLPYVFDRFRQEDASSTRRFGGLGLGLSVVRHLVELHGGFVKAESTGRGQGASFMVTFPLNTDNTTADTNENKSIHTSNAMKPAEKNLVGVSILLLEDSADGRILLERILNQAGAKVIAVDSAAQARAQLQNFKPDVIVSDIGMPEEDGISFIKSIRTHALDSVRAIPAIALTAFVREEEKKQALSAGFQLHVSKPVSASALTAAVQQLRQAVLNQLC